MQIFFIPVKGSRYPPNRRGELNPTSGGSHIQLQVLNPFPLGFATKGGSEAAVHAARHFVENSQHSVAPQAFLKLDVKNPFNSLDRNAVLKATSQELPAYYRFVAQCYGEPFFFLFGDRVIHFQRGVQQGDPLGSLLCLRQGEKGVDARVAP